MTSTYNVHFERDDGKSFQTTGTLEKSRGEPHDSFSIIYSASTTIPMPAIMESDKLFGQYTHIKIEFQEGCWTIYDRKGLDEFLAKVYHEWAKEVCRKASLRPPHKPQSLWSRLKKFLP